MERIYTEDMSLTDLESLRASNKLDKKMKEEIEEKIIIMGILSNYVGLRILKELSDIFKSKRKRVRELDAF